MRCIRFVWHVVLVKSRISKGSACSTEHQQYEYLGAFSKAYQQPELLNCGLSATVSSVFKNALMVKGFMYLF